jgi:hypothetical protein
MSENSNGTGLKLLSRFSLNPQVRTILFVFSALGFITQFHDVALLSSKILDGYEHIYDLIAKYISVFFHLNWDVHLVKILIMYAMLIPLSIDAYLNSRSSEIYKFNIIEFAYSVISGQFISCVWIFKTYFYFREFSAKSSDRYAYMLKGDKVGYFFNLFLSFLILPLISVACIVIYRIVFNRRNFLKIDTYKIRYIASSLITYFVFLIVVIIGYAYDFYTKPSVFDDAYLIVGVLGAISIALVGSITLNPKRVTQFTTIILAIVILAFASHILFPSNS